MKGHNIENKIASFPDTKLGKWAISNSTILAVTIILIVWCIVRNTCGLQASDMIKTIQ
ncbi:MAG: hypothetical protein MJZ15_07735 [Bacteroidales bacterium]|nr:hypothetical protein [Bacteroidales bacterium]